MSKITFRADDDLVDRLESFDASKSEVMRQALREYLDRRDEPDVNTAETAENDAETLDDVLARRVDDLIEERLAAHERPRTPRREPQDLNVNITLDGESASVGASDDEVRKTDAGSASDTPEAARKTCGQCGENVGEDHVYCPNCGEKVSRRVFCECGDEIRSDWSFCPSCGRRTAAGEVLDRS